ncbi:MAG: GreA/GreB family elongation factor [Bacillota bacterium]
MTSIIELSNHAYKYFTGQLAQMEAQKLALFEDFFTAYAPGAPIDDRTEVRLFLDDYLNRVRELLARARVVEGRCPPLPLTLIGCDIRVEDLDRGHSEMFRVVSPYEINPAAGHVSFLSPVGRGLLLKEPGQVLAVQAPGGTFRYRVVSVTYPAG